MRENKLLLYYLVIRINKCYKEIYVASTNLLKWIREICINLRLSMNYYFITVITDILFIF